MRVQTEEWRRFIPGVRMYNGEKTYFYNGEKLWEGNDYGHPLIYDEEERNSWKVIIVLPGVEIIPEWTFYGCDNIKTVIMSDTVKRIEDQAFLLCVSLEFIKLSRNLEYIGHWTFNHCEALTSIFIPPSCREIGDGAFYGCKKLIILGMPRDVQIGGEVFQNTLLITKSPLEIDQRGEYDNDNDETAIQWIKSINEGEAYALHRACASYNPLLDIVYDLVKRQGIQAMRMPNLVGITPSQYLAANTFADISEKEIINRCTLEMMGEIF